LLNEIGLLLEEGGVELHWCPEVNKCDTLDDIANICKQCQRCLLRNEAKQIVFGFGNPNADLMLIGEAPGADEDLQGIPFVGRSGQLLDKILTASGIDKNDVYITNIVKCKPPANRIPNTEEAEACSPYLTRQIEIVLPRIIVCLGALATQRIIRDKARITLIRGTVFEKGGIKIIPTFHPAALLRDPKKKKPVWEDFKKIKAMYDDL
jgi:DNA polymerase